MSVRKRSGIWNHFIEVAPKKARCTYCANYICFSGGNVGNLNRHLKAKHPTVSFVPDRKPMLTTESTDIGTTVTTVPMDIETGCESVEPESDVVQNVTSTGPHRADKIDEQLVKMIVKGHHPYSLVEETAFKKLITIMCPEYSLPTKKIISKILVPKIYRSEMEKAKLKVAAAQAMCLTIDRWTTLNNEHLIAITAHYLLDGALHSTMLGCIQYDETATACGLAEFIKKVIKEWDAQNKITAVVSDHTANIIAAIRAGDWHYIPCFAHTINICVQTALAEISDTTARVAQVVDYFKRNPHAMEQLKETQTRLNVPQIKLKQGVIMRWDSTYEMFRSLVIVKEAIKKTLTLTKSELQPSDNDWATVEAALSILKLFYDVTVDISSEKNVNLSKVIPLCRILSASIRKLLSEQQEQTIPAIQQMTQKLSMQFYRYFSSIEHCILHTEATLLDPRFKDKAFIDKSAAEKAISNLKLKIGSHMTRESCFPPPNIKQEPTTAQSTSSSPPSLWDDFDKEVAAQNPSDHTTAGIAELEKYLMEPLLERTSDPFLWWYDRRLTYPLLYEYLQKRLNAVATSVPSERIFSEAGNILTERRRQLKAAKISELLFISSNAD